MVYFKTEVSCTRQRSDFSIIPPPEESGAEIAAAQAPLFVWLFNAFVWHMVEI